MKVRGYQGNFGFQSLPSTLCESGSPIPPRIDHAVIELLRHHLCPPAILPQECWGCRCSLLHPDLHGLEGSKYRASRLCGKHFSCRVIVLAPKYLLKFSFSLLLLFFHLLMINFHDQFFFFPFLVWVSILLPCLQAVKDVVSTSYCGLMTRLHPNISLSAYLPSFYLLSVLGLNSGPHVCKASTLLLSCIPTSANNLVVLFSPDISVNLCFLPFHLPVLLRVNLACLHPLGGFSSFIPLLFLVFLLDKQD